MNSHSLPERYYDRPTASITTATLSNTISNTSVLPPEPAPTVYSLRLFFSGRDLPEPDSRSRAVQAIVYHAQELPIPNNPRLSNVTDIPVSHSIPSSPSTPSIPSTPSTSPKPQHQQQRQHQQPELGSFKSFPLFRVKSKSTLSSTSFSHNHSLPVHLPTLRRSSSTLLRAPRYAAKHVAPANPEKFTTNNGTQLFRTAWLELGATDVARKQGRDVEFATSFAFNYIPLSNQILRVAFYDATSTKAENHRLIATAELHVADVFATRGKPVSFPLRFLPVCPYDFKRHSKVPNGTLVVAAEHLVPEPQKYLLGVECCRIVRSKALGNASVQRVYFTIHAIFDKEPSSDEWTLLTRSKTVEMIPRKRDGGSTQYNYFSCRRLRSAPGFITEDHDAKARKRSIRSAPGDIVTDTSPNSVMSLIHSALGVKRKRLFFSLPEANFLLTDPTTRLKLTLFEDKGLSAGTEMVADTEFTIADLRSKELGQSTPIRVQASTVGKAVLKYIEYGDDPRYFCLSLRLQGLR